MSGQNNDDGSVPVVRTQASSVTRQNQSRVASIEFKGLVIEREENTARNRTQTTEGFVNGSVVADVVQGVLIPNIVISAGVVTTETQQIGPIRHSTKDTEVLASIEVAPRVTAGQMGFGDPDILRVTLPNGGPRTVENGINRESPLTVVLNNPKLAQEVRDAFRDTVMIKPGEASPVAKPEEGEAMKAVIDRVAAEALRAGQETERVEKRHRGRQ